jgi:hypothetical protein
MTVSCGSARTMVDGLKWIQVFLLRATASGPSSSAEAAALRLDARKALQQWTPTTVKDAMHIRRITDPPGQTTEPEPGTPNPATR